MTFAFQMLDFQLMQLLWKVIDIFWHTLMNSIPFFNITSLEHIKSYLEMDLIFRMRVGLEKYAKCKRGRIKSMHSIGNKVYAKGKYIRMQKSLTLKDYIFHVTYG